jgi:hypothetical protein
VGWRPYSYGHWVWTDYGWYWVSDEPWAWACYHYGTWVYDSYYGWVWVPDIEWAPAWVYWRAGGNYVGWAPCAPRGVVVAPALFVFVDVHRFREPVRPAKLVVNNTTIINQTTPMAEIRRETRTIAGTQQKVVINEGPSPTLIQKSTGKAVTAVPMQDVVRQTPAPATLKQEKLPATGKETPRGLHEQPRREQPPSVVPPLTPSPSAPNTGRTPPPKRVVPPAPGSPPVTPALPGRPTGPPPDNGKGNGPDKDDRP